MYVTSRLKFLVLVGMGVLSGCMDAADRGLGPACEAELVAAEGELREARANSVGRAIDWAKAGGLIAVARAQQQFSEYQNCLLKAEKAREIISRRN